MNLKHCIIFLAVLCSPITSYASEQVEASSSNSDLIQLIIYVLLALIFSFLCSIAEAVLLSITPSYIEGIRETKGKLANTLERLKFKDVDSSLAAILTLNTIAHTVGAIGSGAKATAVFNNNEWYVFFFSAVITLLILFLSEIIPKTLGAVYWRKLTSPTALFINIISVILKWTGFLFVSNLITKMIGGSHAHVFSRDEFIAMTGVGEQSGEIDQDESRIIKNLLRFQSMTAQDIMTPRTVIKAIKGDLTIDEILDNEDKIPFSRLPIYTNDLDDISGFVLHSDLLLYSAKDKGTEKALKLKRQIVTVSNTISLSDLLDKLLEDRQHIALVVGEYGGTRGIVSLEDLIETLLGMEIVDEADHVEDMQTLARELWKQRAEQMGVNLEEDSQEDNNTK